MQPILEEQILTLLQQIWTKLALHSDQLLDPMIDSLEQWMKRGANGVERNALEQEMKLLKKQNQSLAKSAQQGLIDSAFFMEKKREHKSLMQQLKAKRKKEGREKELEMIWQQTKELQQHVVEDPEGRFLQDRHRFSSVIQHITMTKERELIVHFRNGLSLREHMK